jgi:hypothetical protein
VSDLSAQGPRGSAAAPSLDSVETGDDDVDRIVNDFVEARTELVGSPVAGDPEAGRESREEVDVTEQDRLASVVRAAEQAHLRLQQRLSQDRG